MNGLESLFADLAETISNAVLGLDPASRERLASLEGRSLQIESTEPEQTVTLRISDARMLVNLAPADTPNVIVRGRAQDLLSWFGATDHTSQADHRIEIEGDETTLLEIRKVFKQFSPDPFPFDSWAASDLGQNLLGAAEVALAGIRSAVEGATSALREGAATRYADETRVATFLDGIDELKLRVDRLAARVAAAEQASE